MSMFLESVWIILWLVVLYHTPNFDSGDTILKKSGYQALNLDSLSTWPGRPLEGSSTMVLAIRGSPWGWGIMHMRKKQIYIYQFIPRYMPVFRQYIPEFLAIWQRFQWVESHFLATIITYDMMISQFPGPKSPHFYDFYSFQELALPLPSLKLQFHQRRVKIWNQWP